MLTRTQKQENVANLSENFRRAKASFFVDFTGMNVEQITALRKKLHPTQARFQVVRNTLVRRALKENHSESELDKFIGEELVGPNAITFAFDDISASAKILVQEEGLKIKKGLMEGPVLLDAAAIKRLSSLPSKEELQARFLAVLSAPASRLLYLMKGVPENFVRLLGAYREEKEKNKE